MTEEIVAGIDEAGRGPVLGPLVVGGICCSAEKISWLEEIGVKDSKRLTPKKREEIAALLRENCIQFHLVEILPTEIDTGRQEGISLNDLEARAFATIVKELPAQTYYLDAADVIPERFGKKVAKWSGKTNITVVSEHKADDKYLVVGAASILAKTARDQAIERLKEKFGNTGSGYPSDPHTKKFLMRYYEENSCFPDCVRHSWQTARNIVARFAQTSLDQFRGSSKKPTKSGK